MENIEESIAETINVGQNTPELQVEGEKVVTITQPNIPPKVDFQIDAHHMVPNSPRNSSRNDLHVEPTQMGHHTPRSYSKNDLHAEAMHMGLNAQRNYSRNDMHVDGLHMGPNMSRNYSRNELHAEDPHMGHNISRSYSRNELHVDGLHMGLHNMSRNYSRNDLHADDFHMGHNMPRNYSRNDIHADGMHMGHNMARNYSRNDIHAGVGHHGGHNHSPFPPSPALSRTDMEMNRNFSHNNLSHMDDNLSSITARQKRAQFMVEDNFEYYGHRHHHHHHGHNKKNEKLRKFLTILGIILVFFSAVGIVLIVVMTAFSYCSVLPLKPKVNLQTPSTTFSCPQDFSGSKCDEIQAGGVDFLLIPNKTIDNQIESNLYYSSVIKNTLKDCLAECSIQEQCVLAYYSNKDCRFYKSIKTRYFTNSSSNYLYKKLNEFGALYNGLVSYWSFSNNLKDSIGTADLFNGSNASFYYDRLNNPNSSLDLKNGFFQIPSGSFFTEAFTFSAWVLVRSTKNFSRVIELSAGPDNAMVSLILSDGDDNKPFVQIINDYDKNRWISYGVEKLKLNEWTHLIGSFDGTFLNMYINTELVSRIVALKPKKVDTRTKNYIGGSVRPGEGEYADALFDEIRIYNRALNEAEIQNLYSLII